MWWLYVPLAFDDFAVVLIIQEEPDGFRSLNDCTRIWRDGHVEQLGWPRVRIHYRSGTRIPTGATIEASTPDGAPVHFDVESKLAVRPMSVAATGVTRTGHMACGRARSSSSEEPTT